IKSARSMFVVAIGDQNQPLAITRPRRVNMQRPFSVIDGRWDQFEVFGELNRRTGNTTPEPHDVDVVVSVWPRGDIGDPRSVRRPLGFNIDRISGRQGSVLARTQVK